MTFFRRENISGKEHRATTVRKERFGHLYLSHNVNYVNFNSEQIPFILSARFTLCYEEIFGRQAKKIPDYRLHTFPAMHQQTDQGKGMFHVSPLAFSCFFAGNALLTAMSPVIYVRFLRSLPKAPFFTALFAVSLAASLLVLVLGGKGPFWFTCLYAPIGLCWSAWNDLPHFPLSDNLLKS